jgi:hypothetical protein
MSRKRHGRLAIVTAVLHLHNSADVKGRSTPNLG